MSGKTAREVIAGVFCGVEPVVDGDLVADAALAALDAAGFQIVLKSPACQHPLHCRNGQGAVNGADGSGHYEWTCTACGHHESNTWPATRAANNGH